MAIQIPPLPQGTQTVLTIRSNAITHTPTMGGPMQRIARLGDRWVLQIACRSMSYVQAAAVLAALAQGVSNKIMTVVPQDGLVIGTPGSPVVVSGAGTSLSVSGFTSGYGIRAGQYFSLVHNGVRHLHMVTAAATASGGSAMLSVFPMLRVTPTAGSVLEFAVPKIEGFLADPQQSWSVNLVRAVGLNFTIVESA